MRRGREWSELLETSHYAGITSLRESDGKILRLILSDSHLLKNGADFASSSLKCLWPMLSVVAASIGHRELSASMDEIISPWHPKDSFHGSQTA